MNYMLKNDETRHKWTWARSRTFAADVYFNATISSETNATNADLVIKLDMIYVTAIKARVWKHV